MVRFRGIIFFCWLLWCPKLSAQVNPAKMDSLRALLLVLPHTFAGDTNRISVLVELGRQGNNDKMAIGYLSEALLIAQKRQWARGMMIVTCRTGFHYGRMGFDYRACEYFFKGLKLAEGVGDEGYIGFAYRYLGDNHNDLGEFKKAIQYFLKALPHLLKAGDYLRYLTAIHNIGLSYLGMKQYEKAIAYFARCFQENKKYKEKDIDSYCLTNFAVAYEGMGDLDSAMHYLNRFRELSGSSPDDLAYADVQIAHILFLKGHYDSALHFALEADTVEGKIRTNTMKIIHEILYKIYQKKKKYALAFRHLSALFTLQMQNTQDMQRKQIESLKFYYENEKQKSDIVLLNKDVRQKERDKKFLMTGLWAGGLFIVLLFCTIYLVNRKSLKIQAQRNHIREIKDQLDQTNRQLSEVNNSLEQRVQERTNALVIANNELVQKNNEIKEAFFNGQSLERKRVASELHDNLGGTISALKWQFESLETDRLSRDEKVIYDNVLAMMEVAYADVRNISHNLMPAELEKGGLASALGNLLTDLNGSRRIDFKFTSNYVRGFLSRHKEMEVYGVCLELINNILKHARASEASLDLFQTVSELRISLCDDGVGIPQLKAVNENGIGLQNLKNRISEINGQIQVSQVHPTGTRFKIVIFPDQAV